MPGYETTAVTRLACSEDESRAIKEKLEKIILKYDGKLLSYENWGVRRLASRHSKESKGRYHYFAYTSNESSPKEIERNLKINENVLFYLSVRVNDGKSQEDLEELSDPTIIMKAKTTERQEPRDRNRQDFRRVRPSEERPETKGNPNILRQTKAEKGSVEIAADSEE